MSKKYKCPFPECTYETEEVTDTLAAVLLSVHSSGVHVTPGTVNTINPNISTKLERVRRPTISAAGSSEDWSYFLMRSGDYVAATNVTGKEKVIQLLECCDEQLRKDLTRNAGGSLTDKTADEVMAAIKKLAVREENAMVARVQLHNMRQDRDETIRSFGARLRGQAGNVLRDVLTRGLADSEIQLDLLGERNQDMSLEEVFQFIEAKEAGKRSAGRLSQSHSTDAAQSQYPRRPESAVMTAQLMAPSATSNPSPGATAWLYVLKKRMASPAAQSISRRSTSTRHVKPTTRKAPSTRHVQSQATPKRPCLTVGMVTTAFPSMRTIDTSPPSSLHGSLPL
ncbi:unnamed protein product [Pocillopora meandrina]|uniref:Uncharacterized protein n=1 Tax=Pocillopora meandrina TaxID=46732 RepID=A0AAU9VMQ7_9CNID|nr:unnamed protein product [Pocillopora meandrina]